MSRSVSFSRLWAALSIAAALPLGALGWLAGSESGLHWLLARAERAAGDKLRIEDVRGSLISGARAHRLTFEQGGFRLDAERLALALKPAALLRKKVVIENLDVERLTVKAAAGAGPTPLPASLELPFGVEIQAAQVRQLRWTTRDRVLPEAALHLQLHSDGRHHRLPKFHLDTAQGKLRGQVSLDGRAPFPVTGALSASELPGGMGGVELRLTGQLPDLRLDAVTEASWLAASARLDLAPFDARVLHRVRVELARLESTLIPSLPPLRLRGRGELKAAAGGRFAGELELENADAGPLPERVPLTRVAARVLGEEEVWRLEALNGTLPSGEKVSGQAQWSASGMALDLSTAGIDLQGLHRDLVRARLMGGVRAELSGTEQKVDARLEGGKLQFVVGARRDAQGWIVEKGSVRSGRSELEFEGRLGDAPERSFEARGRLRDFDPAAFGRFPQARISADVAVVGALGGNRRADVEVQIRDGVYRGQPVKGFARASLGSERVSGADAEIALGPDRLTAGGAFGAATDKLRIAYDFPRLDYLLEGWRGQTRGWLELSGTRARPGIEFELRAARVAVSGYRFATAEAKGAGSANPEGPLSLALKVQGVRRGETLLFEHLTLDAGGSRRAHRLQLVSQGRDWTARLEVHAGLDDYWRWSGTLARVETVPEETLRLENPLEFSLMRTGLKLGPLKAQVFGAHIETGEFVLDQSRLSTRGRFGGLPLAPLIQAQGWSQLQTDLKLGGEWTLDLTDRLNGSVRVWRESGFLGVAGDLPQSMHLDEARLELTSKDNRLDLQAKVTAGTLGTLNARVRTLAEYRHGQWLIPATAPLLVDVEGQRVSLAWLGQALDPLFASEGELAVRVHGEGTLGQPRLQGEITGQGLGVSVPRHGLRLWDGELRARLNETRLVLETLRMRGETGELRARGEASLAELAPALRIEFDAQGLSLIARQDRELNLDTQGVFTAGREGASLTGRVKVNRALFGAWEDTVPVLSEDVRILGEEWTPPTERDGAHLRMDVTVDLGERLRVRTRPVRTGVAVHLPMTNTGVDARLVGNLRLRGEGTAPPRTDGEIRIVEGQYLAFGQPLKIVQGRLVFAGPLLNPALDIVARRDDPEVLVGVRVAGTARAPQVTLFSQPEASDTEKLAWLLFGRGAQSVEYSVTGLTTASAGVSSFGFQLSKHLYLAYEQGVSGTGSMMRLYSQLTRRFSAQLRSGAENSVRLFYSFSVK